MDNFPKHREKSAVRDAGILASFVALPWLPLLVSGVSAMAFATESVAYRYFHSFRLVRGDPSTIWEAQGQTLGVLHEIFQRLLDWFQVTDLRQRIDLFSYGTLAFNCLAFGAVAWGIGRALPAGWRLRLLLAAPALFVIYGSWWGHFSARLPDYYIYEVTFTGSCLGLFILWSQQLGSKMSASRAMALGALAGTMIGIKITLIPAALLPLLSYLMRTNDRWQQWLRWFTIWMVTVGATVAMVIALYYQFDFSHLAQAVQAWRSFVSAPGAEPGFISSLLHPFAAGNNPWADHRFVVVVVVLWLAALIGLAHALITDRTRRREYLVVALFVLAFSALHVWAVFRRPAETTLFEAALFFATVAAAALASLPALPVYRNATTCWFCVIFGWALFSGVRHLPSAAMIASLQATSRNAWEIHDWLTATGRPVVVLLPDNRSVSGTVEEALLKGFSEVPTWNITSGYGLLDTIAPGRLFVSQISDAPDGAALLWTDVPDVPPLADLSQTPSVVLGRTPQQVRTWRMQRHQYWARTVHGTIFDTGDGLNGLILKNSSAWRDSTPANPLAGYSVSPGDAAPTIELRSDGDRQVLRITATKPTPYLALSGAIPPLPDGSGPLRVKATTRVDKARAVLWQIYDVIGADGPPETVVESIAARPSTWTSWSIKKPTTRFSSPMDNFSVGIVEVKPGDWFEVADLTLLVGPKAIKAP